MNFFKKKHAINFLFKTSWRHNLRAYATLFNAFGGGDNRVDLKCVNYRRFTPSMLLIYYRPTIFMPTSAAARLFAWVKLLSGLTFILLLLCFGLFIFCLFLGWVAKFSDRDTWALFFFESTFHYSLGIENYFFNWTNKFFFIFCLFQDTAALLTKNFFATSGFYSYTLLFFEFISYSWEIWGERASEKYVLARPLYDLLFDNFIYWGMLTVCMLSAQLLFIYFILCVITSFSDHWRLTMNLSQFKDWDYYFRDVEGLNQELDLNFYDGKSSRRAITAFLEFYNQGFIRDEFVYFNLLSRLLRTSRVAFWGYSGFLNLFPSASVILDKERFLKKFLLPRLVNLPLAARYKSVGGWKGLYNKKLSATMAKFHIKEDWGFFLTDYVFRSRRMLWYSAVKGSPLTTQAAMLIENMKNFIDWRFENRLKTKFSYTDWYLAFSESPGTNIMLPKTPFLSESSVFQFYRQEVELLTNNSAWQSVFRRKQLFNFKYGFSNVFGDFSFLSKEINYSAVYEHDYPDNEAPFFETEDFDFGGTSPFDWISPEEIEEFSDEDDTEYADQFYFEDGFLHLDFEGVDFGGDEFDELMLDDGLLRPESIESSASDKQFDYERDEMREDIFDLMITQPGNFRDYDVLTDSSSYRAGTELEFGLEGSYEERVFDTVYDDLVDFFWLNGRVGGVAELFDISKGRAIYNIDLRADTLNDVLSQRLTFGRLAFLFPSAFKRVFLPNLTWMREFWSFSLLFFCLVNFFGFLYWEVLWFFVSGSGVGSSLLFFMVSFFSLIYIVLNRPRYSLFSAYSFDLILIFSYLMSMLNIRSYAPGIDFWSKQKLGISTDLVTAESSSLLLKAQSTLVAQLFYSFGLVKTDFKIKQNLISWGSSSLKNIAASPRLNCVAGDSIHAFRLTFMAEPNVLNINLTPPAFADFTYLGYRYESRIGCQNPTIFNKRESDVLSEDLYFNFNARQILTRINGVSYYKVESSVAFRGLNSISHPSSVFSRFFFYNFFKNYRAHLNDKLTDVTNSTAGFNNLLRKSVGLETVYQPNTGFKSVHLTDKLKTSLTEPKISLLGGVGMVTGEFTNLFLTNRLLERLYTSQLTGATQYNSEQLFYSTFFGFKVKISPGIKFSESSLNNVKFK